MIVRFSKILAIVIVIILTLPGVGLSAESGNGTIEGKLVNGTVEGSSVAGQEVTLKTYRNDTEVSSATVTTDANGQFVFQGLVVESSYSYQVTLIYQQAEYTGDRISFGANETSKSVEMKIYDATTSNEALKVSTAHTVIYVEKGNIRVSELLTVANDSDRTYIGSREISPGVRETITFALPKEASGLQPGASLMECCINNIEGGFVDTMAVLPGVKDLAYSYNISYKGAEYVFSGKVNYPTDDYHLIVQSPNVQVAGARIAQAEPLTIEGAQFNHFSGGNLAPGDMVTAQISGLPKSANQSTVLWVLLAMAALGSGFVFFYLKRRREPQSVQVSYARVEENLLAEIARLDDDYEGGRIAESAYRRLRAQKKAQIVKLMQSSKR
ncbi:MAG: carboxypeptidase-like regulatory domain-containing protein [Dehalococcoidales bacterium]|nr:carboxypeptidase-like regulatory domain-containing protein [Dehalococcoidales bacterium]